MEGQDNTPLISRIQEARRTFPNTSSESKCGKMVPNKRDPSVNERFAKPRRLCHASAMTSDSRTGCTPATPACATRVCATSACNPSETPGANRRASDSKNVCDFIFNTQFDTDGSSVKRLFVIILYVYLKYCACLLRLLASVDLFRAFTSILPAFFKNTRCLLTFFCLLCFTGEAEAYANELDKTEQFLDKINLEQSIAAVFNKVAYGSTTKRSIPDNAYPVTTLATPLLTTYRLVICNN